MELTREQLELLCRVNTGHVALYQYRKNKSLKLLYIAAEIPQALGMTMEEFCQNTKKDCLQIIFEKDQEAVREQVEQAAEGIPVEYTFRVLHKTKDFIWAHCRACYVGTYRKDRVILVTYMNTSQETHSYADLLDHVNSACYVCERGTWELLYANQAALAAWGKGSDYAGKTCYSFIRGRKSPCPWCKIQKMKGTELHLPEVYDPERNTYLRLDCQRLDWYGREAWAVSSVDITDTVRGKKHLEREKQALAKTQNIYQTAVDVAGLTVWEYDIEEQQLFILDRQEDWLAAGLPSVIENMPEGLMTYVQPSSIEAFLGMHEAVKAGRPVRGQDIWYDLRDGQGLRCERISCSVIHDAEGNPVRSYGIGQNVTGQKQAEERYQQALRELKEKNRPDLLEKGHYNLTHNVVCRYEAQSQRAVSLPPEASYDDAVQAMLAAAADDESRQQLGKMLGRPLLLAQYRNGILHFSLEYQRSQAGQPPVWVSTVVNTFVAPEDGGIECFIYTYDLTEKVLAHRVISRLTQLEYEYLGLLDTQSGRFAFYHKDKLGRGYDTATRDYNRVLKKWAQRVAAPEAAELIQALCFDTVRAELKKHETYVYSFDYPEKKRGLRRKSLQYTYLDPQRKIILFSRSDITVRYEQENAQAQKLAEATRLAAEANEAKSTFLANISHDMRTPLNGIIGFTDLALSSYDPARKQDYLRKIKISGALLVSLVNDTLELSKIESGKLVAEPEVTEGQLIVERVTVPIRAAAEEKNVAFSVHADEELLGYVRVDRLKLQEVLLALLSNAVKFTPEGGHVGLEVRYVPEAPDGRNCQLLVRDDGIGIGEQFLPHIFEPFAQERSAEAYDAMGTGLGMAIVKRLLDILGGTIQVASAKGKGTVFTVALPVERLANVQAAALAVKRPEEVLAGKHILVCEDNVLNMEIARTILEDQGVQVTCAMNGQQAIDAFASSGLGSYDAILMDLRMPGVDGYAATEAIRAMARPDAVTVPILAMTADAYSEDVERCLATGMNSHIAKPIDPDRLFTELMRFCEK